MAFNHARQRNHADIAWWFCWENPRCTASEHAEFACFIGRSGGYIKRQLKLYWIHKTLKAILEELRIARVSRPV